MAAVTMKNTSDFLRTEEFEFLVWEVLTPEPIKNMIDGKKQYTLKSGLVCWACRFFFCGSAHSRKESPGFPMPLSRAGERGNTGAYSHTLKNAFKHTLPCVRSAKNHTWCKHQVEPETLSSPVSECLWVLAWGWFCTFYLLIGTNPFRLTCIFPWNALALTTFP